MKVTIGRVIENQKFNEGYVFDAEVTIHLDVMAGSRGTRMSPPEPPEVDLDDIAIDKVWLFNERGDEFPSNHLKNDPVVVTTVESVVDSMLDDLTEDALEAANQKLEGLREAEADMKMEMKRERE